MKRVAMTIGLAALTLPGVAFAGSTIVKCYGGKDRRTGQQRARHRKHAASGRPADHRSQSRRLRRGRLLLVCPWNPAEPCSAAAPERALVTTFVARGGSP
jgi:hypothetical protein